MKSDPLSSVSGLLFQSHPWHGVPVGEHAPERVTVYIEIVPTDTVKYEIDKETGHLKVDRPQEFSNVCPSLYGFVPQTLCAERVAAFSREHTGREDIHGDMDPLDICVITEKNIAHGNILLQAVPIGGFRVIDGGEADDKIISVLHEDAAYADIRELSACPPGLVERLQHYFLTYKQAPGRRKEVCEIADVYDREEALEVIRRSREDYREVYGDVEKLLPRMLGRQDEKDDFGGG